MLTSSYIWGNDSHMYKQFNLNLFDGLENDISCYNNIGSEYVFGHFDSRVGHKSVFNEHDVINSYTLVIDYDPKSTLTRPYWIILIITGYKRNVTSCGSQRSQVVVTQRKLI